LAYWENELKFEVPDQFDLIAGTSTGAIVGAGLALGMSARRVLMMFQEQVGGIFSREGLNFTQKALSFKGWAAPAYSGETLHEVLKVAFGNATLGDCPRLLLIPTLNVVTGASRVFRSGANSADRDILIADAVLASTAAPTFFPSAQVAGSTFVDGALWANNPAMLALLEARDLSGGFLDNLRLLSLGCGRPFWGKGVGYGEKRGLIGWGAPLMSLMMAAQSDGVDSYVERLVPRGQYLRVDPSIPKSLATLDNVESLPELLVHAAEEARDHLADFKELTGIGL